ncbi:hypothetical protein [Deinococcus hopiensis]|uniref:hypothetical protein n=1 Tax=Deinococcus hopiensis TaxID=309885 RepID=UPI00111C2486|nr:hypothetical protein [Deinococcus hopiensis]
MEQSGHSIEKYKNIILFLISFFISIFLLLILSNIFSKNNFIRGSASEIYGLLTEVSIKECGQYVLNNTKDIIICPNPKVQYIDRTTRIISVKDKNLAYLIIKPIAGKAYVTHYHFKNDLIVKRSFSEK